MFHWTAHLNVKPNRSYDHPAVVVDNKLYSFGEYGDMNDRVHVFNTVSLCWMTPVTTTARGERHLVVPSRRWGHTAVLIEHISYIWGGQCASTLKCSNAPYAFDIDTHTWFKPGVSGTVPQERCDHSACVFGKIMYIHGGSNDLLIYNDIYKLDTTTMVWSLINTRGTPPPVSSDHSATIIGTKMFVFGGMGDEGDEGDYNNIRVFDTETNQCWLSTASAQLLPEGRLGHSSFAHNGELYIFGGQYHGEDLNDLWKFNPETFCWKKVEPKGTGPCSGMSWMCCCMVGDRIILIDDDLYILDLSPGLKMLCKLAVIQYNLEQSELPHDIRWELAAMTNQQQEDK